MNAVHDSSTFELAKHCFLFFKAITYYKAAIKSSGYNDLKYDLANLFFQIKRYDDAVEIINNAKELLRNSSECGHVTYAESLLCVKRQKSAGKCH